MHKDYHFFAFKRIGERKNEEEADEEINSVVDNMKLMIDIEQIVPCFFKAAHPHAKNTAWRQATLVSPVFNYYFIVGILYPNH